MIYIYKKEKKTEKEEKRRFLEIQNVKKNRKINSFFYKNDFFINSQKFSKDLKIQIEKMSQKFMF